MAILNNSNAISPSGYDVNNSLRLRSSASAFLNRTPGTTGNQKTFTWSGWVKRGALGSQQFIHHAFYGDSGRYSSIFFTSSDTLRVQSGVYTTGGSTSTSYDYITTQVFRDPSAWYHIVLAVDTTQATSSNRVKVYVNGSQITAFGTSTAPTQNDNTFFNITTTPMYIGKYAEAPGSSFLDGYLAEVNWIDGSQLTPSSFGATDSTTGVWKPKAYSGTYGTNGFYLKFSDIATTSGSNAGLGKDFSGNTNYWTTNNISVTSGATYDAMKDSPTNTSATVANYCVLNPLTAQGNTVVDGNLKVTLIASSVAGLGVRGSLAITSGNKYYWEIQPTTASSIFTVIGIMDANYKFGTDISTAGSNCVLYYKSSGNKIVNGTTTSYGTTYAANDIIGIAVDYSANTCTFYLNNVSQGSISLPSTSIDYIPVVGNVNAVADVFQSNFGQRPFTYTPPTGFVALNTYNLPDSTIKKGNSVMDATLYTGTATTQSITNAGSFKPDLVWVKIRSGAGQHVLSDSVRGISKQVFSSLGNAETTETGKGITAFNSNGFTLGDELVVTGSSNANAATYVGWQWQAGQGTNTSNTSGNVTSTVSVNTTAGFSVVTYTVTSTVGMTIGHGLGVAPKLIIEKTRSSSANWDVYHASLGNTGRLLLNTTGAFDTQAGVWNNTSPTSTVFSQQGNGNWHPVGTTCVAYCWADVSGFSKAFSYTGNGNADGPMVYLGFRPKFILYKNSSSGTAFWRIFDTSRATYNTVNNALYPNSSIAEDTGSGPIDILSNGFKIRTSQANDNNNGDTIIGIAFAENPFKNSNAR